MNDSPVPDSSDAVKKAMKLFDQLLDEKHQITEDDVEELCNTHPALADELRRCFADWRFVQHGLDEAKQGAVSVGPGYSGESAWDRFLEQLRSRGPGHSRYVAEENVASGGMGVIRRVFDQDTRRPLAMKLIMDRTGKTTTAEESGEGTLGRFLEEAQVTAQLDHPGIPPVHELGIDAEGRAYFTMKMVRGRNLHDVFAMVHDRVGGWTRARVLGVLQRVCDAMAFAHSRGVIHRDLKPANIMVGDFGEVYVMDWGLAKVLSRGEGEEKVTTERADLADGGEGWYLETMSGDVLGTPIYMPPEQAEGQHDQLGPASDVYAVGAILYELLADRAPYSDQVGGMKGWAVVDRVKSGPPTRIKDLNPRVSPELVAICEKAMARDPADRYQDMEKMAAELSAHLEGRVVPTYQTGAWAELKKWIMRNRGLAAAMAGVVLAIVVGYVFERIARREADEQRETADSKTRQVYRLADSDRFDNLETEARELWPLNLAMTRPLDHWLGRADLLQSRMDAARADLEGLRGQTDLDGDQSWYLRSLNDLIEKAENFFGTDPHASRYTDIRNRRTLAEELHRRSLVDGEKAWDEAIASIADENDCPLYQGLRIKAQEGLLPIGRNPHSGLWEFAHLHSGEPERPGPDWTPAVTEETGIVLILIPGGSFHMGASKEPVDGEDGIIVDPEADDEEIGGGVVRLDPYFISKYEVTQAQWQRLMGSNPSALSKPTHPVEKTSWFQSTEAARRWGLLLPTEARWEYATRAGTSTLWWIGGVDDAKLISKAGNTLDLSHKEVTQRSLRYDGWDDGFPGHAPVGTFRANPFGLHEVIGNMWEWCVDDYGPLTTPARDGDGVRRLSDSTLGTIRGGCWSSNSASAKSTNRYTGGLDRSYQDSDLGFRPARPLDR